MTLPLTPESRPSANAETRLQGFVFPSVLDGRPDEEADDKSRGENYEDGDHDRCCDVHVKKMLPDRAPLQSRAALQAPPKRRSLRAHAAATAPNRSRNSLEEAVEIAAGHPVAQLGTIEVRPLWGS